MAQKKSTLGYFLLNNPLLLSGLHGAVGKEFVVRQCGNKTVISKFPAKRKSKPSRRELEQREKFKEAVAFAQKVIRDPTLMASMKKRTKCGSSVYNAAMKYFLRLEKKEQVKNLLQTDRLLHGALANDSAEVVKELKLPKRRKAVTKA